MRRARLTVLAATVSTMAALMGVPVVPTVAAATAPGPRGLSAAQAAQAQGAAGSVVTPGSAGLPPGLKVTGELTGQRSASSDTYATSDGRRVARVFSRQMQTTTSRPARVDMCRSWLRWWRRRRAVMCGGIRRGRPMWSFRRRWLVVAACR